MTERDPQIEEEATRLLGYTPDQVKRKTMTQLKRELDEKLGSPPPRRRSPVTAAVRKEKSVTFHTPEQEARGHAVPIQRVALERDVSYDDDDDDAPLDDIVELHKKLQAKIKFTAQLERDSDFSNADLEEWDKSVERARRRLDKAFSRGPNGSNRNDADFLKKLWQRRNDKIAEMQGMGLLDEELLHAWRAKQAVLKQIYRERNK